MIARARAQPFPGVMEARGEEMWCIPCGLRIDYKEKSTATKHVKYNSEHKRQVGQMKKCITKPETLADVVSSLGVKDHCGFARGRAPIFVVPSYSRCNRTFI